MNHVNATSAAAAQPRAAGSKRMSPPVLTSRDPTSDLSGGQLEWAPAGLDWQDVALQMRILLSRGISFAKVDARGAGVRPPGTVLVVTAAGESIGFNPAGPLDRAIRDLAAEALAAGQNRLEHLRIDKDAAAYIGHSGEISLEVHVLHVRGGDPTFASVLRYLDSGAAAVLIIGDRGAAGCAVVGADRVVGQLGRPALPIPVIDDARRMLRCRRTISRTYRPSREKSGTGIRVWMMAYPRA